MSKPTKKKLCEHGFPTQLSACPVCRGDYAAWVKKERGLTGKFKAIEDMPKVRGKGLPMPLMWEDQCECGQTRLHHEGKHGVGRSVESGCPSFKEAA